MRDVDRFNVMMQHAGPNTERYWLNDDVEQLDADNIYLDAADRQRGSAAASGRRRVATRNRRSDTSGSRRRRNNRQSYNTVEHGNEN